MSKVERISRKEQELLLNKKRELGIQVLSIYTHPKPHPSPLVREKKKFCCWQPMVLLHENVKL